MYILTNEKAGKLVGHNFNNLLNYLPGNLRALTMSINPEELEEIRIRNGKPLTVSLNSGSFYLDRKGNIRTNGTNAYIVTKDDIDDAVEMITHGSLYALQNELRQGYITISGGHRIGVFGKAVVQDGEMTGIKEISALNYRFAKEITGAADKVISGIRENGMLKNTLVVSPPQCGKTTLLRDIARQLSYLGHKISIIDERSEIAGMVDAVCSYDIGPFTDVLDGCPKAYGMMIALRSMSPDALITDEIGTSADIEAINTALSCGVNVIASVHARDRSDLERKPGFEHIYNMFDCVITLSKRNGSGTVEEMYSS